MALPFPVLAAASFIITTSFAFAADELPKFDVEKSCQASYSADAGGADRQRIPSCIADEKTAGETITRNWASYPPRDRDHCERLATLGGMAMASYVEMLTCLEIARDTKTLPTDIKKSGLPKQ